MKIVATIALLLVATFAGRAQILPTAATSARSATGQFLVLAPPPTAFGTSRPPATKADWVQLEPTLLAISAERVKQAVWRELDVTGAWRQKITIVLHPARTDDDDFTAISEQTFRGWSGRVEMPDQMSRQHYLRALVQVVLLELANRSADDRPAEIPAWLVEGFAHQLLANNSTELILNPPGLQPNGISASSVSADFHRLSPLEKAHKTLLGTTPLTFEELSWPAPGQQESAEYRACAQLFTHELLRLDNGPSCMRVFLATLPRYQNWQLAFLRAFAPHFSRPLDIEKWWALQAAEFAGRDLIQTWPYEESWSKLAAALRQPVDVFANTNELPTHATVTLQTILRHWDPARQNDVLRGKVDELNSLRLRIAPELSTLTLEYARVIQACLAERNVPAGGGTHLRGAAAEFPRRTQSGVLARLDALDARLEKLRPGSVAVGTAIPGPR